MPIVAAPDATKHPCFQPESGRGWARVHLPVAPRCNVQCNFCDRKYSCSSESRPGVTSSVLSPEEAASLVDRLRSEGMPLSVVGIAGPGDAFANVDETLETLRLVRRAHPDLLLCLSTNGLDLEPWIDEIDRIGVSHVTMTVNAVDPATAARIYSWIRTDGTTWRGEDAGRILVERQAAALAKLSMRPILVKVNTVVIPGVNDHQVGDIARRVADLGADLHNCMPMIPVAGTPFASIEEPDPRLIGRVRAEAGRHIPQMTHCTRCRADACGLLGDGKHACA